VREQRVVSLTGAASAVPLTAAQVVDMEDKIAVRTCAFDSRTMLSFPSWVTGASCYRAGPGTSWLALLPHEEGTAGRHESPCVHALNAFVAVASLTLLWCVASCGARDSESKGFRPRVLRPLIHNVSDGWVHADMRCAYAWVGVCKKSRALTGAFWCREHSPR
jgi:hypothetical protein